MYKILAALWLTIGIYFTYLNLQEIFKDRESVFVFEIFLMIPLSCLMCLSGVISAIAYFMAKYADKEIELYKCNEQEIIIDGVNVAMCEFFNNKNNNLLCDTFKNARCTDDYNCCFKQLQRLKAKNEELKNKLNIVIDALRYCATREIGTNEWTARMALKHVLGFNQTNNRRK